MFFRLLGFLLVVFSVSTQLTAQDSLFTIHNIRVEGNDLTEDFIILKQVPIERGEKVSRSKLDYYMNRVYSFQLFTKVEYRLEAQDELGYDLVISVTERWYWAVLPRFRLLNSSLSDAIKNPSRSKIMYGGSVIHNNLFGRAISASFSALFGYNTEITFGFYNPYLLIDDHLSFGVQFHYSVAHSESPYMLNYSSEYIKYTRFISNSYGYTLNPYQSFSLSYSLQSISNGDFVTLYPHTVLNAKGAADETLGFSLNYKLDTRDWVEYAREGNFFNLIVSTKQELNTNQNYRQSRIDFRTYFHVTDRVSLSSALLHQQYYGELIPYYDHNLHRRDEYSIRSYENLSLENINMFVAKFEARTELIKIRTDEISWISWKQFRFVRWGLFGYLFSDYAYTHRPSSQYIALNHYIDYTSENPYYDTWLASIGAGIHVALPYSNFLRFEVAVNKSKSVSFWINSGRAF